MRLNVRCCCDGTRILGTLEVPDGALTRAHFRLLVRDAGDVVDIHLRQFYDPRHGYEAAVYSEDRPIAFWRGIPSFREGDKA